MIVPISRNKESNIGQTEKMNKKFHSKWSLGKSNKGNKGNKGTMPRCEEFVSFSLHKDILDLKAKLSEKESELLRMECRYLEMQIRIFSNTRTTSPAPSHQQALCHLVLVQSRPHQLAAWPARPRSGRSWWGGWWWGGDGYDDGADVNQRPWGVAGLYLLNPYIALTFDSANGFWATNI